ncbi:MAG: hypothetical protein N7Q72_02895, partial [Spiroplasma sp. Tabriz.8]|nr:hypothetical protein [Spiroplasma sp. Tabriz.8]
MYFVSQLQLIFIVLVNCNLQFYCSSIFCIYYYYYYYYCNHLIWFRLFCLSPYFSNIITSILVVFDGWNICSLLR